MGHHEGRPIKTCEELCPEGIVLPDRALVMWKEFLKLVRAVSGISVTRRTLQLYSSPEFRLVPEPVYARRHTSHYRHPEDTMRLAAVLHLRDAYYFPVAVLRSLLQTLDPRFYPMILSDLLAPKEIKVLAAAGPGKPDWTELDRRRASTLLKGLIASGDAGIDTSLDLGAAVKRAEELRLPWADVRVPCGVGMAAAGNGD